MMILWLNSVDKYEWTKAGKKERKGTAKARRNGNIRNERMRQG